MSYRAKLVNVLIRFRKKMWIVNKLKWNVWFVCVFPGFWSLDFPQRPNQIENDWDSWFFSKYVKRGHYPVLWSNSYFSVTQTQHYKRCDEIHNICLFLESLYQRKYLKKKKILSSSGSYSNHVSEWRFIIDGNEERFE